MGNGAKVKSMQIFQKKKSSSPMKHIFIRIGLVNAQNCQILGSSNSHAIHEKQMHPKRATVWFGFWSGGVNGTYFLKMRPKLQ